MGKGLELEEEGNEMRRKGDCGAPHFVLQLRRMGRKNGVGGWFGDVVGCEYLLVLFDADPKLLPLKFTRHRSRHLNSSQIHHTIAKLMQ